MRPKCARCWKPGGAGEPPLCDLCDAALQCAINLDETLDRELWWQTQLDTLMLVFRPQSASRSETEGTE